jgi:predicted transcriptional regulator
MEQRVITAHIPIDLAKLIDAIADRLDRSRGWIFKQALLDWVALEEERRRMTLDALSEVDREAIVGEAEVQAWAASLGTPEPLPPPC